MMKSPSYCYKFYWLEAIIQLISEGKTESTFDEIIDEMITNAWYSVREFHIHLSGMPLDLKPTEQLIGMKLKMMKSRDLQCQCNPSAEPCVARVAILLHSAGK